MGESGYDALEPPNKVMSMRDGKREGVGLQELKARKKCYRYTVDEDADSDRQDGNHEVDRGA